MLLPVNSYSYASKISKSIQIYTHVYSNMISLEVNVAKTLRTDVVRRVKGTHGHVEALNDSFERVHVQNGIGVIMSRR